MMTRSLAHYSKTDCALIVLCTLILVMHFVDVKYCWHANTSKIEEEEEEEEEEEARSRGQ